MVKVYVRKGNKGALDTVVFVVSDEIAEEFEKKAMKITNEQLLQIIEAIKISEYNKKQDLVTNKGYYIKMAIDELFTSDKSPEEILARYKKGGSMVHEDKS